MKKIGITGLLGCWVIGLLSLAVAQEVAWQDIGGGNTDIRTALVHPQDPKIIYFGSRSGVLKSEDGGRTWRNVLLTGGQNRQVNFLSFDFQNNSSVYAATGEGLLYSSNQGKNWKRIFKGKSYLEKECTVVASLPYAIILGTKAGLFVSTDKGRNWYKAGGQLGSSHILAITYGSKELNNIYIATRDGVFKSSDRGQSWERVFVASPAENGEDKEDSIDDQDEEKKFSSIRYLTIDPQDSNILYLGTQKGVYRSTDKGKSWNMMPTFGLLNREVKFLLLSPRSDIYAIIRSGIFRYNQDRWEELSLRLAANEVRFLSLDKQNSLYAATEKGLFKTEARVTVSQGDSRLSVYYNNEPDIREVQRAAVKYAEVEPEKIIRWRKQAAHRAWLPQVSMGLDRNTTDLWHWEGGSTTKTDDDTLRRGRDSIEWDVTLAWDLSGLIYSDDQTNIDVRSKLMVQLRNDILDEVTKLYFERLRLKMELDNLSIEDRKKRFDKELKLQELTAYLDALTGGYFSQRINDGKA